MAKWFLIPLLLHAIRTILPSLYGAWGAAVVHSSALDTHTTAVLATAGNNDVKEDYVLEVTNGSRPNAMLQVWADAWGKDLDKDQVTRLARPL